MIITVTSKGQIVIPAPVRKKLNIQKGKKFVVSVEDNRIILEPVEDVIRRSRGLLKKDGQKILEYLLEERKMNLGADLVEKALNECLMSQASG